MQAAQWTPGTDSSTWRSPFPSARLTSAISSSTDDRTRRRASAPGAQQLIACSHPEARIRRVSRQAPPVRHAGLDLDDPDWPSAMSTGRAELVPDRIRAGQCGPCGRWRGFARRREAARIGTALPSRSTSARRASPCSTSSVARPAKRRLRARRRHLAVELLACDIGIAHDEAGPARPGDGRHGDVHGDDHGEEGDHDHQHVAAGEAACFGWRGRSHGSLEPRSLRRSCRSRSSTCPR